VEEASQGQDLELDPCLLIVESPLSSCFRIWACSDVCLKTSATDLHV